MRRLIITLLCLASTHGYGQTPASCSHTLTVVPVGPVLVYQNGVLGIQQSTFRAQGIPQGEVGTYSSSTALLPAIAPLAWRDGDHMTATFTRLVPLAFRLPSAQTVTYYAYELWQESWLCLGQSGTVAPAPSTFPGCTSDGNQGIACGGGFAAGVGTQFAAAIAFGGINFLLPNDPTVDPTGKTIKDLGVASCAGMDPKQVGGLPCHQLIWQ